MPVRHVTDSAKRALRAAIAGRRPDGTSRWAGSLGAHRERQAAHKQFVRNYPVFSQLILARSGELWVRAFAIEDAIPFRQTRQNKAPSDWSIYDAEGRWLADCRLPARFTPHDIGADYVLGVASDEDDVERVVLWALRR
jgi:hypothetical protein